jgi:hypothetical protein
MIFTIEFFRIRESDNVLATLDGSRKFREQLT